MKTIFRLIFTSLSLFLLNACDYVDREVVKNYGKEETTPVDTTEVEDTTEVRMRKFLVKLKLWKICMAKK